MPDHDESEYVTKLSELAQTFIKTDPLVEALSNEDTTDIERLEGLMRLVAQECAALLYQRESLQSENRDAVPQLCSRRIDGLMKLASLVVQREEAVRGSGELDDHLVLTLVGHLVMKVEEVVREVADSVRADSFMKSLRGQMIEAGFPSRLP